MYRPLALPGEGLHFAWVTRPLALLLASFVLWAAVPAMAQVEEADPDRQSPLIIIPELQLEPPALTIPDPDDLPPPDESIPEAPIPDVDAPDYSRLSSNEERTARLEDMFERLALAESEESGNLIAEEVWAVWLDSGSASVNLVLRRGAEAQARNDNALARVMYDHVTQLQSDYAEGWARSSRLALEERDFARAVGEAVRTLTIEPRHFYALWTLGNVLERLGRSDEALDAYREANRLHPTLKTVADRVAALELQLGGGVL